MLENERKRTTFVLEAKKKKTIPNSSTKKQKMKGNFLFPKLGTRVPKIMNWKSLVLKVGYSSTQNYELGISHFSAFFFEKSQNKYHNISNFNTIQIHNNQCHTDLIKWHLWSHLNIQRII